MFYVVLLYVVQVVDWLNTDKKEERVSIDLVQPETMVVRDLTVQNALKWHTLIGRVRFK